MEQNVNTRRVTIINTKSQSQTVIPDSKATTLGELKAEMREKGIDYEGMTFYEGHMRAELMDDASFLPSNIVYKGQVVRDLCFMLTTPNKKIGSGIMSREKAYEAIWDLGLQNEIKLRFGKNFTQCSTANLEAVIEEFKSKESKEKKDSDKGESEVGLARVRAALTSLINALYADDVINQKLHDELFAILKGEIAVLSGDTIYDTERMSKEEIDDMFDFVSR